MNVLFKKPWGQTSNTIELPSCLVHVLCYFKRLHDIKKLSYVSLEYAMEVHLTDAYILPFW